jgi:SAM-dependent methyltransferase
MSRTSNASAQPSTPSMPYVDGFLDRIAQGDSEVSSMDHWHWGYWDDPSTADGSREDYEKATERLTSLVLDAAQIADGMRVIDCGCGIGGTVGRINEQFSDVRLTGVNIDERQLALARERVQARPGNEVDFVHADACDLPFESESADAVIALECIFHFPSRRKFLREVHRVLRPGGSLAITDLVPRARSLPILGTKRSSLAMYGEMNVPMPVVGYKALARMTSMPIRDNIDISKGITPTFEPFGNLTAVATPGGREGVDAVEEMFKRGQMRYHLITFEKK